MVTNRGLSITAGMLLVVCGLLFFPGVGFSRTDDCAAAERFRNDARAKWGSNPKALCRAYEKMVELCPSNVRFRVELGDSLVSLAAEQLNAPAEARKAEAGSESRPTVVAFDESLTKAEKSYEKALSLDSSAVGARSGLGSVYYMQGRYGLAAEQYKKASALKPDDKTAQSGLARSEEALASDTGGFKDARQIRQRITARPSDSGKKLKLMGFDNRTAKAVGDIVKDRLSFNNILFAEWSAGIDQPEALQQLAEIGQVLRDLPDYRIVIEGHTDNRGDYDRNWGLSEERAQAIRHYLTGAYQVAPDRMATRGFGYSRPRVPNDSDENMRRNRRVEIVFMPPAEGSGGGQEQ
ncbi:MAG: OmpA family protein [Pseudomonadota bacterium]